MMGDWSDATRDDLLQFPSLVPVPRDRVRQLESVVRITCSVDNDEAHHPFPTLAALHMVLRCIWQSSRRAGSVAALAIGCLSVAGVSLWAAARRRRRQGNPALVTVPDPAQAEREDAAEGEHEEDPEPAQGGAAFPHARPEPGLGAGGHGCHSPARLVRIAARTASCMAVGWPPLDVPFRSDLSRDLFPGACRGVLS